MQPKYREEIAHFLNKQADFDEYAMKFDEPATKNKKAA
jgi:hypothetical protein